MRKVIVGWGPYNRVFYGDSCLSDLLELKNKEGMNTAMKSKTSKMYYI